MSILTLQLCIPRQQLFDVEEICININIKIRNINTDWNTKGYFRVFNYWSMATILEKPDFPQRGIIVTLLH